MKDGHETAAERTLDAKLVASVERVLQLAKTWLAWDGRARIADDRKRIYTPHKAIRRHADHLIDHLAQVERLLAGLPGEPDGWLGSSVTLAADWAPFREADLNEAEQRLLRLGAIFAERVRKLDDADLDCKRDSGWTIREIVEHVADTWYAEQVGDLLIS